LSKQSCPSSPVLEVLSWQFCPFSLVLPVLFCLFCSAYPALPDRPVLFCPVMFCLSCSDCPILSILLRLSYPDSPGVPDLSRQSCECEPWIGGHQFNKDFMIFSRNYRSKRQNILPMGRYFWWSA
jgi:hypothetical protein